MNRVLALAVLLLPSTAAAVEVNLAPSFPSPGGVGDTVVWTATAADNNAGSLWCRFRVRPAEGEFRTVVDFGPETSFAWTPADREGVYEIEVTARNRQTGEAASASRQFQVVPRAASGRPVITPTIHPLVMLYSAPPCSPGNSMWVRFQPPQGDAVQTLPKACTGASTMNFYLAGMRGGIQYNARHIISGPAGVETGPELPFRVEPVEGYFAGYQVLKDPSADAESCVLLQSTTLTQKVVATDLACNLLWYYPHSLAFLTRPESGGSFFGIQQLFDGAGPERQLLREIDLTGTTLRETNAARINEQLAAMGKRSITSFHHEAGALPDGRILVLAATEEILTDVQGPGPVNVIGEMILVLDPDLQVEWTWDAFDHLDPRNAAVLGEVCRGGGGAGCPPYYLTREANDWLHANSVTLTPDGSLVMSIRHLDWVIKIDYSNGRGSGRILWRLGKDGDFRLAGAGEDAWFSHQHDAFMLPGGEVLLFDNGNTRARDNADVVSRGQLWKLDEANRTATPVLNVPLGVYSAALGSAQRLGNGNFHFGIGWIGATASRSVEVTAEGEVLYEIGAAAPAYRTFRMQSLYTP